jgi:hypothetical protein
LPSGRHSLALVAELDAELARNLAQDPGFLTAASDRAAIAEAKHLARMIRTLAPRPYRGDPYRVAYERWIKGESD